MKTKIEGGVTTVSTGTDTWTCRNSSQAVKHLATWTDGKRHGSKPAETISKGDVTMVKDFHAEQTKKSVHRATKSYVMRNGVLVSK